MNKSNENRDFRKLDRWILLLLVRGEDKEFYRGYNNLYLIL